jgi:hypothetical protein
VTRGTAAVSIAADINDLRQNPLLMVLALSCVLGATTLLIRRVTVANLITFALAAVAWLAVDGSVEGPTLVHLTRPHGVTVADLLPIVALGLVGIDRMSARRRSARSSRTRDGT